MRLALLALLALLAGCTIVAPSVLGHGAHRNNAQVDRDRAHALEQRRCIEQRDARQGAAATILDLDARKRVLADPSACAHDVRPGEYRSVGGNIVTGVIIGALVDLTLAFVVYVSIAQGMDRTH